MRLNRFDTSKIRVRSSSGRRGMPGSTSGQIGIGTLILAAITYFVLGVDPIETIATMEEMHQGTAQEAGQRSGLSEQEICSSGPYATEACYALLSLNRTWKAEFRHAGVRFGPVLLSR